MADHLIVVVREARRPEPARGCPRTGAASAETAARCDQRREALRGGRSTTWRSPPTIGWAARDVAAPRWPPRSPPARWRGRRRWWAAPSAFSSWSWSTRRTRVQGGRPIGGYQAIQHACADLVRDVDTARGLLYLAAWKTAEGQPADERHRHRQGARRARRAWRLPVGAIRSSARSATARSTRSTCSTSGSRPPRSISATRSTISRPSRNPSASSSARPAPSALRPGPSASGWSTREDARPRR